MLTVWIKPYEGEALSSFLMRLAMSNGVDIVTLWNHIKMTHFGMAQKSDIHLIDFTPHTVINLDLFSKLTELTIEELLNLTFYNTLYKFNHSDKMYTSRILRGMIREKLHYCPECLKEKRYLRLIWKIEGVKICSKHLCYLCTHCKSCYKEISLSGIYSTGIKHCPECSHELSDKIKMGIADKQLLKQQNWLHLSWEGLFQKSNLQLTPSEVAQRLLFIINEKSPEYNYSLLVEYCKKLDINYQSLLQCARDSQKQIRAIHIAQLLEICYLKDTLPIELLNLTIPESFLKQLLNTSNLNHDAPLCLAPWCNSYLKSNSLVRMGNYYKKLKSGRVLKNQLTCTECGCQYVWNENGEQLEKDQFINGFKHLTTNPALSYNELARRLVIPTSKCKKIVAYFNARKSNIEWDEELLTKIKVGIKENVGAEEIKHWTCWSNRMHFLTYYYHIEVIRERIFKKRTMQPRVSWDKKIIELESICNEMLQKDKDITISLVSVALGVSENTIQKYQQAHSRIMEYKLIQKEQRLKKWADELYIKINEFVENFTGERFLSKELYKYIGVRQSYLVKAAPEVNDYIINIRKAYNCKSRN